MAATMKISSNPRRGFAEVVQSTTSTTCTTAMVGATESGQSSLSLFPLFVPKRHTARTQGADECASMTSCAPERIGRELLGRSTSTCAASFTWLLLRAQYKIAVHPGCICNNRARVVPRPAQALISPIPASVCINPLSGAQRCHPMPL